SAARRSDRSSSGISGIGRAPAGPPCILSRPLAGKGSARDAWFPKTYLRGRLTPAPAASSEERTARLGVGAALPRPTRRQRARHEGVQVAVQHALGVAGLVGGAQVLHHLVGLEDIAAGLVAPARIALGVMRVVDRGGAPVQLHLVEPRLQRV